MLIFIEIDITLNINKNLQPDIWYIYNVLYRIKSDLRWIKFKHGKKHYLCDNKFITIVIRLLNYVPYRVFK